MRFRIHMQTNSREDVIAIGHMLGKAIEKAGRDEPLLIVNDGDKNSGKSLIAIATDQYLNPQLYPAGISTYAMPNETLAGEPNQSRQTILYNFMHDPVPNTNVFCERVAEVKKFYRDFKVVFMQNPYVVQSDTIDYTRRMPSNLLDVAILVRTLPGQFVRQIDAFFRDGSLLPHIADHFAAMRRNMVTANPDGNNMPSRGLSLRPHGIPLNAG